MEPSIRRPWQSSNCQDLWIGVSGGQPLSPGLLGCVVGSFDEFALLEQRSCSDEGDQVWGVHGAPAGLGGLDELERHGDPGGPGARSLGDALAEPDGGEGGLDRVGGAQVDPVFGGEVVERQ